MVILRGLPLWMNAIHRPSGDHDGLNSAACDDVSRVAESPSIVLMYMRGGVSRDAETYATCRPSGDSVGCTSVSCSAVIGIGRMGAGTVSGVRGRTMLTATRMNSRRAP